MSDQRSSLHVPADALVTHLVEDRRSTISPWGRGNSKLGPGVYTYSRLPGKVGGTCPGSTSECEAICYAKRVVSNIPVWDLWRRNSEDSEVPPVPADATVVRIHVSGDFDTPKYILNWLARVQERPDVRFWSYTRSWRVHNLEPYLRALRDAPNVQLFASVDKSSELPPWGWRRAWINKDERVVSIPAEDRDWQGWATVEEADNFALVPAPDRMARAYICPEETGRKANCAECNYCISGVRGDVVFIEH